MIKKFKDVREGDTIYIISPDSGEIEKCKVYCCRRKYEYYNSIYVYLYVMNHDAPVIVRDFQTKSCYTFTTIEQAEERLSTIIQNKHKRLEIIIDQKVKEYDKLVESLELLEQQVSNNTDETKNLVYFKDIKIGDFIFWINKADLKIEKLK